jgi:hypothetical protein
MYSLFLRHTLSWLFTILSVPGAHSVCDRTYNEYGAVGVNGKFQLDM